MATYDQFPIISQLLERALHLSEQGEPFSDDLYIEIFSAIRLNMRNALTVNTVSDLAYVIHTSSPKTQLARAFSKGILIQAAIVVTRFHEENWIIRSFLTQFYNWLGVIPNDQRDLVSALDFVKSESILGEIDDPEWLVANLEARHSLVGKDGYEHEMMIAQTLLGHAKSFHPIVYLLALETVAEIGMHYRDLHSGFTFAQQAVILAHHYHRYQDVREGLMIMAGSILYKQHDRSVVKNILNHWDKVETRSTSLIRQAELNSIVWQLYYADGEYEKAIKLVEFALNVGRVIQNHIFECKLLIAAGMIYTKQRDFRRAINAALDCAELARFHGFYDLHVWALHVHGWTLKESEEYAESVEVLTKCLHYQRQLEPSLRKTSFENNIVPDLALSLEKADWSKISDETLQLLDGLISTLENPTNVQVLRELLHSG